MTLFSLFPQINRKMPVSKSETCNFIEKETQAQVFFRKFSKIFKNTFFTEFLQETALYFIGGKKHSRKNKVDVIYCSY